MLFNGVAIAPGRLDLIAVGGDPGAPSAPSSLTATANGSDQIDLAWTDNSSTETVFRIYRSPDNVTFTHIDSVAANTTSYSDIGLQSTTTYYYYVTAFDGSAESGASNTANDMTAALLDSATDVEAAYSTRKLLSAYAGDALRLRRDSDNSEQDIGFDANGQLDTGAIDTFLSGANGLVVTWYDQSGNSRDVTQATNGAQPPLEQSVEIASQQHSLSFDGGDSLASSNFVSALSQPNIVFFAAADTGADTASGVAFDGISGSRHLIGFAGTTQKWFINAGSSVSSTHDYDERFHVAKAIFNGASSSLDVQSYEEASGNAGANSLGGINIGTAHDGSNFIGYISEVFVLGSSQNTDSIELDMINRFGAGMSSVVYDPGTSTSQEILTHSAYLIHYTDYQIYRSRAIESFLRDGVVYQVLAGWDYFGYLTISYRKTLDGDWTTYTYNGDDVSLPTIQVTDNDAHRIISFGVDKDGYLHIAYDMHNEALKYRVSDNPIGTSWGGGLGAETSLLGTNETSVTYPIFINDPAGNLYWMHRSGTSNNGDWYLYAYDEGTASWAAATGTSTNGLLIDGANLQTPYPDTPVFDTDFGSGGYMHIGFVWRGNDATDNSDYSYVKWDGTDFFQDDGTSQTIPITKANANVINAIPVDSQLSNTNSIAVDSNGNPHIAYVKEDASSDPQIWHQYFNGTSWTETQVTSITSALTWPGPITRPVIAIDTSNDTAYITFAHDDGTQGILVAVSDPADFSVWNTSQLVADNGRINDDISGERWEANFDRYQWINNGVFYIIYPT